MKKPCEYSYDYKGTSGTLTAKDWMKAQEIATSIVKGLFPELTEKSIKKEMKIRRVRS